MGQWPIWLSNVTAWLLTKTQDHVSARVTTSQTAQASTHIKIKAQSNHSEEHHSRIDLTPLRTLPDCNNELHHHICCYHRRPVCRICKCFSSRSIRICSSHEIDGPIYHLIVFLRSAQRRWITWRLFVQRLRLRLYKRTRGLGEGVR